MVVVAHGNVEEYCAAHGWTIVGRYHGKIENYSFEHPVIVTDALHDRNEYYYLKYKFMRRGIELVSVWHEHDDDMNSFLAYLRSHCVGTKHGGRLAFGFHRVGGKVVEDPAVIAVARRIIALRDAGLTYKEISETDGIRYPDGRKMGISTIQVIVKNRSKYGMVDD